MSNKLNCYFETRRPSKYQNISDVKDQRYILWDRPYTIRGKQFIYIFFIYYKDSIIIIYDVIVKETLFRIVPLLKMGKKLQMRAKNFNNEKLGL